MPSLHPGQTKSRQPQHMEVEGPCCAKPSQTPHPTQTQQSPPPSRPTRTKPTRPHLANWISHLLRQRRPHQQKGIHNFSSFAIPDPSISSLTPSKLATRKSSSTTSTRSCDSLPPGDSRQPHYVATSTAPSAPRSPTSSTRPTTASIRLLLPTNNGKIQPSVTSPHDDQRYAPHAYVVIMKAHIFSCDLIKVNIMDI